jgi:hypothetical protein
LLKKNSELYARQEEVHAETQRLGQEERRSQVSWVVQAPKPKPQPIRRHSGAVALVGDLLSPQPEEEINPPPPRPSWPGEQRARDLGAESEAIAEAIKLLGPEIARARKEYSRKISDQRGAEYTAIVEKIVDAAKVLGDELLTHHSFINQRRLDGVAWRYLNPINVNDFGDLDEDFSPLRKLILDAVEKRHVSAGHLPDWKMPVELAYLQGGS